MEQLSNTTTRSTPRRRRVGKELRQREAAGLRDEGEMLGSRRRNSIDPSGDVGTRDADPAGEFALVQPGPSAGLPDSVSEVHSMLLPDLEQTSNNQVASFGTDPRDTPLDMAERPPRLFITPAWQAAALAKLAKLGKDEPWLVAELARRHKRDAKKIRSQVWRMLHLKGHRSNWMVGPTSDVLDIPLPESVGDEAADEPIRRTTAEDVVVGTKWNVIERALRTLEELNPDEHKRVTAEIVELAFEELSERERKKQ